MTSTTCPDCGRPRMLDGFSGAGGAGMGYYRAGFCVTGVDRRAQPRYPFRFVQGDALEFLAAHAAEFAAIHVSPPCQRFTKGAARWGTSDDHPDLVDPARELLAASGRPWVIENVEQAPLRSPIVLCGTMFGRTLTWEGQPRELRRHRLFESNVRLVPPGRCAHVHQAVSVHGNPGGRSRRDQISFPGADGWRSLMGMPWATARELAQAIPPAYTQHLGAQLLLHVATITELETAA